ncbi:MAG TPA: hypothetical protein VIY51_09955 [Xanthobacteraceae bacterium]
MSPIRPILVLLFAAFALAMPAWVDGAWADGVVFPPGSRVGFVPPPGLTVSTNFPGFEDRAKNVAVLLGALPPEAYGEFEKSDSAEGLKQLGATFEKRETLTLPTGKALLVIGHQDKISIWMLIASTPDLTAMVTLRMLDSAKDVYPDQVIRAAFESLAVRAEVPVEEQLGLLPFKLAALAGFKIGAVLPGRGIVLTDVAADPRKEIAPHIVVSLMAGAPAADKSGDREELARQVFRGIPNLKDVRITAAAPLRIGGLPGHEIMATAKDPATGADITLVQWLRFGTGAFLHLVGIAPTGAWTPAYGRFRAVRDGIE